MGGGSLGLPLGPFSCNMQQSFLVVLATPNLDGCGSSWLVLNKVLAPFRQCILLTRLLYKALGTFGPGPGQPLHVSMPQIVATETCKFEKDFNKTFDRISRATYMCNKYLLFFGTCIGLREPRGSVAESVRFDRKTV